MDFTLVIAHNFFHQKDSWRRFYFDVSCFSSSDWRISHALSHHIYTNTLLDMEISGLEPLLNFLPNMHKTWLMRYGSCILTVIFYPLAIPLELPRRICFILIGKASIKPENMLPFIGLLIIYIFNTNIYRSLW